MTPIVMAIVATVLPLVLFGLVSGWRRRIPAALLIGAGAFLAGVGVEALAWSDLWALPAASGLGPDLLLLLMWVALGAVLRAGGPMALVGPPLLVAMAMGACLGEIPAAALLSASARSRSGAARLALAAAGGGLIGRLGDPVLVLFGHRDPDLLLFLAPLGLLLAIMAAPRREDVKDLVPGSYLRSLFVLLVAVAACVPGADYWAVGVGLVGGLIMVRSRLGSVDLGYLCWMVVAIALALMAIAGGTPEMAATGLEYIGEQLGTWGAPGLTVVGAVFAALTDGTAAAVCGLGVLDRAMSLQIQGASFGLAAGLAVGGLGPLMAAGALRAGWRRWALQVLVAVVYVAVWAT